MALFWHSPNHKKYIFCRPGQNPTMIIYSDNIYSCSVTVLCRLIVHCRMTIQYRACVQRPLEAPSREWSEHAGVSACSDWSPESSRRTACRNHSDFQGAWKLWGFLHPFGSALSADHVRTALISPNSHSDSCISVQTEPILKGWPAVFLYFVMLMFRVALTGARRMQRTGCPNAWSGRKIRGRDVPAG